jgi:tetratricopeptide (TPR) repeat protein
VEKGATQFTTPALSTLSELYQEQGAYEKAIKYLRRLKKEADGRQNQLQALSGLMIANHRLAYYKTSAKRAKQLLDLDYLSDAKQNLARYYLAKSYFQQKQYAEALPLLEKVYKQNKGEKGAEALYLKAAVQYKQQQYKNAQQTIYKLRDEFTNYNYWVARGFVLLGDVFLKLDNAFQAKATLQSVADNYEGEELVRRAQKKLQQIREQEQAKQQPDSTNPSQPDSINKLEDD